MAGLMFKYADEKGILPELYSAMDKFLKSRKWIRKSSSAFRSTSKQKIINAQVAKQHGVKQNADGSVYACGKYWASAYGRSNHNYGMALDMDGMNSVTNEELKPFGLCKPMVHEPWHFELIKFRGLSQDQKKVLYFQYTHGLVADGICGPKTRAKMAELGVKKI
jgi:hypothetical protein